MHINTGTVTLLPQWDLEYTKNYNTKHAQCILAVYREVIFFSSEEGLVKVFPTRGKKEVHGSKDYYSSTSQEGKAEDSS